MEAIASNLRYVDAEQLATPLGSLDGAEVVGPEESPVGRLDGVLIDPLERQVRFFVVESRGWFSTHHYLLSATPTRLEHGGNTLRVDVDADEISRLPEIHPEALRRFSDDDLISAMFAANHR